MHFPLYTFNVASTGRKHLFLVKGGLVYKLPTQFINTFGC